MPAPSWPELVQAPLARALAARWGGTVYPWTLPMGSRYGWRRNPDPATRAAEPVTWHSGQDIPLPRGTPVIAVWPGVIVRVDQDGAPGSKWNGNAVHLRSGPFTFGYLHLDTVRVSAGELVEQGRILGTVGNTGHSFGFHLHFQVTLAGRTIDPLLLYPGVLFRQKGA